MPSLVNHCNVVMGNVWAAEKMLGVTVQRKNESNTSIYLEQGLTTSQEMQRQFPRCTQVANTFRFETGNTIRYYATLYGQSKLFVSPVMHTKEAVDNIGSGDTFMAGFIYGNVHQHAPQAIIDFAAAAALNKLFIKGDASTATLNEICAALNRIAEPKRVRRKRPSIDNKTPGS